MKVLNAFRGQRGAITKDESRPILVFFPLKIMPLIDAAVRHEDSDRSKFIRNAVRDRLRSLAMVSKEGE